MPRSQVVDSPIGILEVPAERRDCTPDPLPEYHDHCVASHETTPAPRQQTAVFGRSYRPAGYRVLPAAGGALLSRSPALEGISRVPDVSLVGLNIDARVLAGLSTRLPTPSSVGGATAPAAGGGVAYPSSCSACRFMLCSGAGLVFTRLGQQLAERAVLRANAGTIFHGGHYVKRRAGGPGAGTDSYRQRPDERGQLLIPFRGRRDRATARTCTMGG